MEQQEEAVGGRVHSEEKPNSAAEGSEGTSQRGSTTSLGYEGANNNPLPLTGICYQLQERCVEPQLSATLFLGSVSDYP